MTPIPEATDERAATGLALPRDVIDRLTIEALQELVYELGGEALRYRVAATEQRLRAESMARRADIANDRLAELTQLAEGLEIAQQTIAVQSQTIALQDATIKSIIGKVKRATTRKRKAVRRG